MGARRELSIIQIAIRALFYRAARRAGTAQTNARRKRLLAAGVEDDQDVGLLVRRLVLLVLLLRAVRGLVLGGDILRGLVLRGDVLILRRRVLVLRRRSVLLVLGGDVLRRRVLRGDVLRRLILRGDIFILRWRVLVLRSILLGDVLRGR